jgi:hypothetical protein
LKERSAEEKNEGHEGVRKKDRRKGSPKIYPCGREGKKSRGKSVLEKGTKSAKV